MILGTVWIAGLAAAAASVILAIITALGVLQLAMASSAKRVIIPYSTVVITKVALATLASTLKINDIIEILILFIKICKYKDNSIFFLFY